MPEPPGQHLGQAIRALREHAGHSLDDVAHYGWSEAVRLSASQIGQIERGEKQPRHQTLIAILRGIGAPPAEWPEPIRAAVVSGELNYREVGVDQALATLKKLNAGQIVEVLELAVDDPAEEMAQAVEDAAPSHARRRNGRARKPAANGAKRRAAAPRKRARP